MASTVNQAAAEGSTPSLMVGTWTVRDPKSPDATFALGSRLCGLRHENPWLRQFSSLGGPGRWRFRPGCPVFGKHLISAAQVRGSRLPWLGPGGGGGGGAGRRGGGGGRTSSGGGYCCWWRGQCWRSGGGRGFLPESRGGLPSPYLQSSWKPGSRRLAAGWAAACPLAARAAPGGGAATYCIPRGAELDSSLRAPRSAARGRPARRGAPARVLPPAGQPGQGRAGPRACSCSSPPASNERFPGSRSSEEGVARDRSLPLPLPRSHSPCPPPLVFLPAQPPSHAIPTCPELQIQPSQHQQTGTKLQPAVPLPGSGGNGTRMVITDPRPVLF
ncbi:Hypothetical predicted protein [Marmota monax]|uniref:Uncharacterized protein n=1 Tax=Marmota monax TaxID=9995 RepID=A0A5E4CGV7_MARMO|nr:Hypothetical predicted protein [Marmota monax]